MYYKKELANLIIFDGTRGDLITLPLPKWAGASGNLAVDIAAWRGGAYSSLGVMYISAPVF